MLLPRNELYVAIPPPKRLPKNPPTTRAPGIGIAAVASTPNLPPAYAPPSMAPM